MSALSHDTPPPCPRTPAEIADQWAFFTDPAYPSKERDYARGVLESLRWVMGRRADSPVAGDRLGRLPTLWDIETEADRAEEGMRAFTGQGIAWHRAHGLRYLTGAENALFWLTGEGGETIY
ncbi:hypothetical protein [Planomonospora sp. ID82291]|uniref:hypothetical protein n=1 Tax=Planomonospora sp. ID82291 TaxID=2738136 RepID=UPI0018C44862|nr:hypothetical protein [Planomonospora sp. ID82291]MBG0819119.1 hypothetical protein [Planomonospora sp. ID82291]